MEYNDEITEYDYIFSAVGNAYFSGLTFKELWACVSVAKNREELDIAVDITIKLKESIDAVRN